MKKCILILSLLCVAISFASCKNTNDVVSKPMSELTESELRAKVEKTMMLDFTLQSGSMVLKMETSIEEVGKNTVINNEVVLKNYNPTNDKSQKYYSYSIKSYDIDVKNEVTLKDGVLYVSLPRGKYYSNDGGDSFNSTTNYAFYTFSHDELLEAKNKISLLSETEDYYEISIEQELEDGNDDHLSIDLENVEYIKTESIKCIARISKNNKLSLLKTETLSKAKVDGREITLTTVRTMEYDYNIPMIDLPEDLSDYIELPNIYVLDNSDEIVNDFINSGFVAFDNTNDFSLKSAKKEYSTGSTANVEVIFPNNVLKFKVTGKANENGDEYDFLWKYNGTKMIMTNGDETKENEISPLNAYGYLYSYFEHADIMREKGILSSIDKDGYKTIIRYDIEEEYANTLMNGYIYSAFRDIGAYNDLTFETKEFECVTESDLKGSRLVAITFVLKGSFEASGEKYTFSCRKTIDNVTKLDESIKDFDI